MSIIGRALIWFFYGLGWAAFASALALLALAAVCAVVPSGWDLDDAWWLVMPPGAVAGLYFAGRLRKVFGVHLAFAVGGAVTVVVSLIIAFDLLVTPDEPRFGLHGLGQYLYGLLALACAILAALVTISGIAGLHLRSCLKKNA